MSIVHNTDTKKVLLQFMYEGHSISSRTNSFKKITENSNSKTVLSFFNIISMHINTTFPAFHKSPEARGIDIFVSCVEELQDMLLIVLKFKSSQKFLQRSKRMKITWS